MRRLLDWWERRHHGPRTRAYDAAHHRPVTYSTRQPKACVRTTRRKR